MSSTKCGVSIPLVLLCLVAVSVALSTSATDVAPPSLWKEVEALSKVGPPKDRRIHIPFGIRNAKSLRATRDASIKKLIEILRNADLSDVTRVEAAVMLGDLRASEAVDALIENIALLPGDHVFQEPSPETVYRCYGALLKIGKPASKRALTLLRTELDSKLRCRLVWVVREVEGLPTAKFLVKSELDGKPDAVARKHLEEALKQLEDWGED